MGDVMLNKEAMRFTQRKAVKAILGNKELTNTHKARLNQLFMKFRCKELENMHNTIATFVLYDLNNYEGRLRRLKGIPGTSQFTQLLRYGKKHFRQVLGIQTNKKTAHFQNTMSFWVNRGLSESDAKVEVSKCQTRRSLLSPATQKGATEYSHRCVGYWLKQGLSESDAKIAVCNFQRREHTIERNIRWQATLNAKSTDEKQLINAKKGHSVEANMLRGMSYNDALVVSNLYYSKRNNYSKSSQVFFSILESLLGDSNVYYKVKNYEKQINGKCVDFYHCSSSTAIEFYGDFWHRNPKTYSSDFIAYGKRSDTIWQEDTVRIAKIKESAEARRVIIIWESDVLVNPHLVAEQIIMEIQHGN
jgi:hypothetical protein